MKPFLLSLIAFLLIVSRTAPSDISPASIKLHRSSTEVAYVGPEAEKIYRQLSEVTAKVLRYIQGFPMLIEKKGDQVTCRYIELTRYECTVKYPVSFELDFQVLPDGTVTSNR